jgi:lysophospholipase L1-like esterase
VPPQDFECLYADYLSTVRNAYPAARVFAVCPHPRADLAAAIANAVRAQHDQMMTSLDYSSGVISTEETCDGCHLNPGGAVALATRLARDISQAA